MAHYFITGHTGFKGAWLVLLLKSRGNEVSGLALDPFEGSLFARANLKSDLTFDFRADVRVFDEVRKALKLAQPDFVVHMAAQAQVREGYRNPLYTYQTNVDGTSNVLRAIDETDSVRAHLVVTSDKVYLDRGDGWPHLENDVLGGKDPYSASKAMADILAQEWLGRSDGTPGAIARAGNVIGTGDYSVDRLIPDIVRASQSGKLLKLRNPRAVRPWQHVLDCLNGYLLLLEAAHSQGIRGPWNFGPDLNSSLSVQDVALEAQALGLDFSFQVEAEPLGWLETQVLRIDSSRAREVLGWEPRLSERKALSLAFSDVLTPHSGSIRDLIEGQVHSFESLTL